MKQWIILMLLIFITGCTTQPLKQSPSGNSIAIKGSSFNPASIKITKGTEITWTNQDSVPHTVVFGDKTESNSLSKGNSYSKIFNEAGTFDYHCGIHPSMKGKVIVE